MEDEEGDFRRLDRRCGFSRLRTEDEEENFSSFGLLLRVWPIADERRRKEDEEGVFFVVRPSSPSLVFGRLLRLL